MDEQAFLTMFLADRDAPCPGCMYNLRGLRGETCPECRQVLRLAVGLVEPRLGAWIAALVGLAAGFGFNLLLFAYALVVFGLRTRQARLDYFVLHNLSGLVLGGALLTLWILGLRRIRRWPLAARIACIAAAWGLTLANFGLFTLYVR